MSVVVASDVLVLGSKIVTADNTVYCLSHLGYVLCWNDWLCFCNVVTEITVVSEYSNFKKHLKSDTIHIFTPDAVDVKPF